MRLHPLFMVYKGANGVIVVTTKRGVDRENRLFLLLFNKRFSNLFVCPKQ